MSRFRKEYRGLSEQEVEFLDALKSHAEYLEEIFEDELFINDERCRALALTKLEEAVMWAVKGATG